VSSHGSTSNPSGRKPVSALIVTWNNLATLAECMTALRRELPAEGEILTFDNHSLDDSAQIAQDCGALVQRHGSNIGFAAGMNRLAAVAHGDVLLVVNPDVFVSPGSIWALLSHFPEGSERKIVGGLLSRTSGEPERASARPFPTAASLTRWLVTREGGTWAIPTSAQEVQAVSGAFFAITRSLWRELGGFDEGYLHSGEDLDLFWRAAQSRATVWFEPAAKAIHLGGASVRQAPLQIDAVRISGMLRLVRRREGRLAAAVLRAMLLLRSLIALVLDRLRIHPLSAQRRARAKALLGLAVAGEGDPRLRLPAAPKRPE
jgi:N-acetylglucosaminyl-diphospho-decaprenol L-rhamnosyltransferase